MTLTLPPALAPLQQRWQQLADNLDQRSLRERVLIFALSLALCYAIADTLILGGLMVRMGSTQARIETMRNDLRKHDQQVQILASQLRTDPNAALRQQRESLHTRQQQLQAELQTRQQSLIPPQTMVVRLHEMLQERPPIRLVSLKTFKPAPLAGITLAAGKTPSGTADNAPAAAGNVATPSREPPRQATAARIPWQHDVEITVRGPYLDVMAYLHYLEQRDWQVGWQSLNLQQDRHPEIVATLRLSTLNLHDAWLGL